jgi:hypothetical protein
MKPLAIDLYCGLGGWTEGLLAEGYDVIGFDIERHDYGTGGYPAQLVIQDVLTLHGKQFRDAALIVASPPCQAYSYRAMPWSRAKALPPPDNSLFEACFRIQREANEACDMCRCGHSFFVHDRQYGCADCECHGFRKRYIPMVVENVRGAQKWVGRARWNFGSFYLWGDVPALMPMGRGRKNSGGSWFAVANNTTSGHSRNPVHDGTKTIGHVNKRDGYGYTRHLTNQAESDGVKQAGISGLRANGKGDLWFQDGAARSGSKSNARKAASAQIAKIPFALSSWIGRVYLPCKP